MSDKRTDFISPSAPASSILEPEQEWESLTIRSDFLFYKVMESHPDLLLQLLQRLFPKLEIEGISFPYAQRYAKITEDGKGSRLDIIVKTLQGEIINLEMQVRSIKNMPKRTRFYSSILDLVLLDSGEEYNKLPASYIVFLCPFDPFGIDMYRYSFERRCIEAPNIVLNDDLKIVFFNASSKQPEIPESLRSFFLYMMQDHAEVDSDDTDPFIHDLHRAVLYAKQNQEWRREYMILSAKFADIMSEGREIGLEIGREEGREIGLEIGRKEGREEGRAEGREEGRAEEKINTERERLRAQEADLRALAAERKATEAEQTIEKLSAMIETLQAKLDSLSADRR